MKIYFVKPGDTLEGIAQRNGVDLEALIGANPQLADQDSLNPGTKIKIPVKPAALQEADAGRVEPGAQQNTSLSEAADSSQAAANAAQPSAYAAPSAGNAAQTAANIAQQYPNAAQIAPAQWNASAWPEYGMANAQQTAPQAFMPPVFAGNTPPVYGTANTGPVFGTMFANPAFGAANAAPAYGLPGTMPIFAPSYGTPNAGPMFDPSYTSPAYGTAYTGLAPMYANPAFEAANAPDSMPGAAQTAPSDQPQIFAQQTHTDAAAPDLFKDEPIPAVPAASLYDLPAMEQAAQIPWGMPYPQMNAIFQMPQKPCGCGGKTGAAGVPYQSVSGWPEAVPYSQWIPYAQPYQPPAAPPQGIMVHGSQIPTDSELEIETGRKAEPKAKTSQLQVETRSGTEPGAGVSKKGKARRKRKQNPVIAKIRKLSSARPKPARTRQESLPWIKQ